MFQHPDFDGQFHKPTTFYLGPNTGMDVRRSVFWMVLGSLNVKFQYGTLDAEEFGEFVSSAPNLEN